MGAGIGVASAGGAGVGMRVTLGFVSSFWSMGTLADKESELRRRARLGSIVSIDILSSGLAVAICPLAIGSLYCGEGVWGPPLSADED